MRFTSTIFFLASLAASSLATADEVKAVMAEILNALNTLDASLDAFSQTGGDFGVAVVVHSNAVNLTTALSKGTSVANNTLPRPVAEADGKAILASAEAFSGVVNDTVSKIVASKAAFQALPTGGNIPTLIKQDIGGVCVVVCPDFQSLMLALYPADLVAEATALSKRNAAACASAIAAYADV